MSFPDLVTPIYEAAKKRIKIMPQHVNRASSLGGECLRELVYQRSHWDKAAPHGVDLQLIFEEGAIHEKEVLKALSDCGWAIFEQQITLQWPDFQITGHIDAMVMVDSEKAFPLPLEIKSMASHIWDSIAFRGPGCYQWPEVAEKFQSKPWLKKYLAQLTLYALMKNVDKAILLCKSKGTGALAQVNIEVDYSYGEELLRKAESVNAHVKAGTLPERIPYDENICPRCRFYAECLPNQVGFDPLEFVEDARLGELLVERAKNEEAGKEFRKIDGLVKEIIKAKPWTKAAIGNFLIQKTGNEARTVIKIECLSSS